MKFTSGQLLVLSDLFSDIAKGLFLASVASSALSVRVRLINSFLFVILGMISMYLSLRTMELKEKYE
ncbi:MAG: hypothetical protein ABFQ62_01670 [Patescibacteria group bacterium]